MFSVRYQTPSAGAEEIHPGRRGDRGRGGRGEGKVEKREVSGILSLCTFLFLSVSETVRARPRGAVLGHKAESAL